MNPLLTFKKENKTIVFTSQISSETLAFESELSQVRNVVLTLPQSQAYLKNLKEEFYILQISDENKLPLFQVVVNVRRSRVFPIFKSACVFQLGNSFVSTEAESFGLKTLTELCQKNLGVSELRLQPYRLEQFELWNFESRLRRLGFQSVDPISYTRTILISLAGSIEECFSRFSTKTRSKFRPANKQKIEILPLTDDSFIPACEKALDEALSRTGVLGATFDFKNHFRIARETPSLVRIFGLFLKDSPNELLAYVIALNHGRTVEYSSAGSLLHPELRKIPFNYLLIGEMMTWAKEVGASYLDLGGVTDGLLDDPRAGISEFKRHLSQNEMEVGREMLLVYQPLIKIIYGVLASFKTKLKSYGLQLRERSKNLFPRSLKEQVQPKILEPRF